MVDRLTDWVSQMTVVEKTNSDVRICLDPIPYSTKAAWGKIILQS